MGTGWSALKTTALVALVVSATALPGCARSSDEHPIVLRGNLEEGFTPADGEWGTELVGSSKTPWKTSWYWLVMDTDSRVEASDGSSWSAGSTKVSSSMERNRDELARMSVVVYGRVTEGARVTVDRVQVTGPASVSAPTTSQVAAVCTSEPTRRFVTEGALIEPLIGAGETGAALIHIQISEPIGETDWTIEGEQWALIDGETIIEGATRRRTRKAFVEMLSQPDVSAPSGPFVTLACEVRGPGVYVTRMTVEEPAQAKLRRP